MELRELLAAMRSAWWLVLVGVVTGSVLSLLISLAQTPLYTSHMRLFISSTDSTSVANAYQGSQLSESRVTSYAQLLTSQRLLSRVIANLHLPMTFDQLSSEISATAVTDTVLLDVTVTDPSARRARDIADASSAQFSAMVVQLETSPGASSSPVTVSVVDAPEVPATASSPQPKRNLVLGGLIGLVAGAAAAVAYVRADRTVRDPDVAAQLVGAPVIGTVIRDDELATEHRYSSAAVGGVAEAYRQLRTNLQYLNVDNPPKTIMISSATPGEGKTTLAINLASALAEAGRRVTIVEADLRRPRITRYLNMVQGAGLTSVLAGLADLDDVVQVYGDNHLRVVPAGPIPPNPGELLASAQMAACIRDLREDNDFVVIDTPPLLPVADASSVAAMADGVLLAVRYGEARKDEVHQAATTLERVGATISGVVLNVVPPKAGLAVTYGLQYGYAPDPVMEPRRKPGQSPADDGAMSGHHGSPVETAARQADVPPTRLDRQAAPSQQ